MPQSPTKSPGKKIVVDPHLTRRAVSYQGNKTSPGFRWLKFKEGFSASLVESLLSISGGKSVLDPFSGAGTTILTACKMGKRSVGMDVMPISEKMVGVMDSAAHVSINDVRDAADGIMLSMKGSGDGIPFEHLRITRGAFPPRTERELSRARHAIKSIGDESIKNIINFAVMSVLEEVSYTRKDGQFLRWDPRSGRDVAAVLDKGRLPLLNKAFEMKIKQIIEDMPHVKSAYAGPRPVARTESSLKALRKMKPRSIDAVVTSPPYANRYDYTRTYALELAWMGYSETGISALRQAMLTATVENRPKGEWLAKVYGRSSLPGEAADVCAKNRRLQSALKYLKRHAAELNNPHIIRLVENYFAEMAVIIAELGRIVRKNGNVFMVNDNVRYHGMDIPVDIILSEFAEKSGFTCESIRALPRGKGNSSQQMGKFGRSELRKCIYRWKR
ncbi:DNA modification methylase [Cenarchaeum symbiosum A]|uniref:site-specific DNA-methyltransferase (cytosine-N(4)-specific) n=1 Tax=Cenarchaeum symbiosum (strain A) TaxID=414004 RepID=A0RVU7_CENSY|nr:DNA modification methylase [Cenarchaeum symbiosum A]